MSIFSERVRDLRLSMNLSLRQLAKITGISHSAISAYEMGSREPSVESLEALADAFNCDIEYLRGKTDIKNAVANSLGYDSLYDAYKANALLTPEEQALLDLFRQIPEEDQAIVLKMIEAALK